MKTSIKRFVYITIVWLIAITFVFLTGCNTVTADDITGGPKFDEMTSDNSLTFVDDNITGINVTYYFYTLDDVKFRSKKKYVYFIQTDSGMVYTVAICNAKPIDKIKH